MVDALCLQAPRTHYSIGHGRFSRILRWIYWHVSPSADTRYLLQKIDWSQGIFGKPMVTAATRSKENVHGAVRVEHWSADPGSWMIRVANWGWWVKEHFRLTVLCVPQVLLLFLQLDCSHSTKSSAEIFYRILWYPADWILSSNASQKHQLWHASCAPKVCGYIIQKNLLSSDCS